MNHRVPETVLVVDNVEEWCELIAERLRALFPELNVVTATKVDEARKIIANLNGSLKAVLTDLHLDSNGENGDKLIRFIIENYPELAFAIVSGSHTTESKIQVAEESELTLLSKDAFIADDESSQAKRLSNKLRALLNSTARESEPDLMGLLDTIAESLGMTPVSKVFVDEIKGRVSAVLVKHSEELQRHPLESFLTLPDPNSPHLAAEVHEFKNSMELLLRRLRDNGANKKLIDELTSVHQYIVDHWKEATEIREEADLHAIARDIAKRLDPLGNLIEIIDDEVGRIMSPISKEIGQILVTEMIQNAMKHRGFDKVEVVMRADGGIEVGNYEEDFEASVIRIKDNQVTHGKLNPDGMGLSYLMEQAQKAGLMFSFDHDGCGWTLASLSPRSVSTPLEDQIEFTGKPLKVCLVCNEHRVSSTFSKIMTSPLLDISIGQYWDNGIEGVPEDTDLIIAHLGFVDEHKLVRNLEEQNIGSRVLPVSNHPNKLNFFVYRDPRFLTFENSFERHSTSLSAESILALMEEIRKTN